MIVNKNNPDMLLPLYEVEEVTVEQALSLLNLQQRYTADRVVSGAGHPNRITGEMDEIQQSIDGLINLRGPIRALG
jgi:hypothetical protein